VASTSGWALIEHSDSTAWSSARTPVDSHSCSGVCTVMRGSRITAAAPIQVPV
jgi:hypothetical protein